VTQLSSICSILAVDPELAEGVDARALPFATRTAIARSFTLEPGELEELPTAPLGHAGDLGLLVLDGLIERVVVLAGRRSAELLGPGDVLRPWEHDATGPVIPLAVAWEVLTPTRLAVLDAGFARRVAPWPAIGAAIVGRCVRRTQDLAFQLGLSTHTRVDVRLLLLLWHLASRWGRVTLDGVHLPLRLTHKLLGELVGARRPSVTLAATNLARLELVFHERDGWHLNGDVENHLRFVESATGHAAVHLRQLRSAG